MSWTSELPTARGWYWARTPLHATVPATPGAMMVCFIYGDLAKPQNHDHFYQRQPWEWWPEPVHEPATVAAALTARLATAADGLERYGEHESSCNVYAENSEDISTSPICTCGLSAALQAARREGEGGAGV